MFKIAAVVSLMLIGSTLWAAGISCDSCGSECASACGTRHFRSCCFNYLRRKRGPEIKLWTANPEMKESQQEKLPVYIVKSVQEPWFASLPSDYKPYPFEDTLENHLMAYDA